MFEHRKVWCSKMVLDVCECTEFDQSFQFHLALNLEHYTLYQRHLLPFNFVMFVYRIRIRIRYIYWMPDSLY